jgi:hypothetical protein
MYRLNQQRLEIFVQYELLNEPEGQSASYFVLEARAASIHAPMHCWRYAQPSARVISEQKLQHKVHKTTNKKTVRMLAI